MLPAALLHIACVVAAGLQGVHSFEPAWERVLVGTSPVPDALTTDPAPVSLRGRFAPAGDVLRVLEPPVVGDSTWLSAVNIEDGVVRARFVVGERLDASVLVRASVNATGELDAGYAISFEKGLLKLYRYTHRMPRALGAEANIAGPLVRGSVLELVVLLNGPFIDATVFDTATLEPRARVLARDRAFSRGLVGVRFARADVDSALSLLSVGTGAHELAAFDEGAGPERLVTLAPAQARAVPADLRARLLPVAQAAGAPEVLSLVTDLTGLERVRRAGVVTLTVSADMPFKYVDPSLRARLGQRPTQTRSGLRVDESYKDADGVFAIMRGYAELFPRITQLVELGRSVEDRPILALKISRNPHDDEDEPALLLNGAHHGGELMSTEQVLDAMQQLLERYGKDAASTRLVDELAWWLVPLVNPDGLMRYVHFSRDADRKNARDSDGNAQVDATDGVDLYRNYPVRWGALEEVGSRSWPYHPRYRGPAAASEPEVQAIMGLAARERFTASIDFHTSATLVLAPYTDPLMTNPANNEAWTIAEELVAQLPVQVNGRRYSVERNIYPVDGTCQDWLRFSFGTVALLVEGPTHNPLPYAKGRSAHVLGTRPTWQLLATRVLEGPGIVGRVRDTEGRPVAAEVIVQELAPRMGEMWTTRPRDGRFHRMVPSGGAYTVRVQAEGFATVVRRVVVQGAGHAKVDVTLERYP